MHSCWSELWVTWRRAQEAMRDQFLVIPDLKRPFGVTLFTGEKKKKVKKNKPSSLVEKLPCRTEQKDVIICFMQILTAAIKHAKCLVPLLFESTEKWKTSSKNSTICASSQPSSSIHHSFSIATPLAEVAFLKTISGEMAKKAVKSKLHRLPI